ncbi:hypothetical protein DFH09DRAFT_1288145 [Mycena vulgaris]|nr:hypothetical protein DFH09DRAFT_1288145 [Mycena vulgaris]
MHACALPQSTWLFPASHASLDFSRLRHLDVWNVPEFPIWDVAQSASATLEHLALELTLPGVDLARFAQLRRLEWHPTGDAFDEAEICALCALPPDNRLQTLVLRITADAVVPADFGVELAGLALAHPDLRHVEVRFWHPKMVRDLPVLFREVVFPSVYVPDHICFTIRKFLPN